MGFGGIIRNNAGAVALAGALGVLPWVAPAQRDAMPSAPLAADEEVRALLDAEARLRVGLEVCEDDLWPYLRNKRVTLITNNEAIDPRGRHTLQVLADARRLSLTDVVLVNDGRPRSQAIQRVLDEYPRLRVHDLPPGQFQIPEESFRENETIVFDAVLRGPRIMQEWAALAASQEAASLNRKTFVVLDRPPVMSARFVEGPPAAPQYYGTQKAYMPVPMVCGLTAGELARLFNVHFGLSADLHVMEMEGWQRTDGNAWLFEQGMLQPSDRGRAQRAEVRASPLWLEGQVPFAATAALLPEDAWEIATVLEDSPVYATLMLKPRAVSAQTLAERLDGLELEAVAPRIELQEAPPSAGSGGATTQTMVMIVPDGPGPISPSLLSLQLRFAGSSEAGGNYTLEEESLYAQPGVADLARQGIAPSQMRRRWLLRPEFIEFLEGREQALIYP